MTHTLVDAQVAFWRMVELGKVHLDRSADRGLTNDERRAAYERLIAAVRALEESEAREARNEQI